MYSVVKTEPGCGKRACGWGGKGRAGSGSECVYRGRVPWLTQVPVRLKVTSAGREKGADRVVLIENNRVETLGKLHGLGNRRGFTW